MYIGLMKDSWELKDLVSVGPATLKDFDDLGITLMEQLIDKDARELFENLQLIKEQKLDPNSVDLYRFRLSATGVG